MTRRPPLWASLMVALVAVAGSAPALGQQDAVPTDILIEGVRIRVVPDPRPPGAPDLTVGDPFWATVVTRGPGSYGLLPESLVGAYRAREELAVLDTDRRDGQLRLRLALFRPGDVVLPTVRARVVTDVGDTIAVSVTSDTIRVASVLAPGDTLLADIKPLWPERRIPAWVWWLLAALAALALIAYLLWRRRRAGRAGPAHLHPPADPYAVARARLEALAVEPPGPLERIAAAAEIGDALRGYLAAAWALPARERTTFELLPLLPEAAEGTRGALGSVFAVVDLAKYARVAPEPGRIPELADRALDALERLERARRPPVAETPAVRASGEAS